MKMLTDPGPEPLQPEFHTQTPATCSALKAVYSYIESYAPNLNPFNYRYFCLRSNNPQNVKSREKPRPSYSKPRQLGFAR